MVKLIDFNREYQNRVLGYFVKIRNAFHQAYPHIIYPGLFGEVDSITGKMRPLNRQKVWSWGDTRGLGIWSYLLLKNVIPDKEIKTGEEVVNLKCSIMQYCDHIYESLIRRHEINGGHIPFIVDIRSNKASDDPENIQCGEGECEPTQVFAAAGFLQYGLMKKNQESLELGKKFLNESFTCGINYKNVDHVTKQRTPYLGHGFLMITLGAIVDTLKCLKYSEYENDIKSELEHRLLDKGLFISEHIINNYCNPETGQFWEYNTKQGKPYIDPDGHLICDPGHVSEACAFMAEFETIYHKTAFRHAAQLATIMRVISQMAFSDVGLMYKNIDLLTGNGMYDKMDAQGVKYMTAPWWNIREACAAAIKLYEMTRDKEMLKLYLRARRATYRHYPNEKIGGLMVQTLDANTANPLPFHPATGNLDPLHCTRAREREIEALEMLGRVR